MKAQHDESLLQMWPLPPHPKKNNNNIHHSNRCFSSIKESACWRTYIYFLWRINHSLRKKKKACLSFETLPWHRVAQCSNCLCASCLAMVQWEASRKALLPSCGGKTDNQSDPSTLRTAFILKDFSVRIFLPGYSCTAPQSRKKIILEKWKII